MGYKSLLETQTILVQQPALDDVFQDMEWIQGTVPDPFEVKCNVQPYSYKQRRWAAPEGYRIEDLVCIYSQDYQLKSSSVDPHRSADIFQYRNEWYEVLPQQYWYDYGLTTDHFACIA